MRRCARSEAAATAAWHPNPTAQAAFLTSCKAKLQESPAAMSLLVQVDGDGTLSPEDVRYLAGVLLAEQKPSPQPVVEASVWPVIDGKWRSMGEQRRITGKVKAALNQQHFLHDDGVRPFCILILHIRKLTCDIISDAIYSDQAPLALKAGAFCH